MKDNADCGVELCGQAPCERGQRLDAARGCADDACVRPAPGLRPGDAADYPVHA